MNALIDISNVILVTERLVLRPWRESDLEDLYEYSKVEGVGKMAGWCAPKRIDDSKEVLYRFIREKKTFAIELKGKVVGSLGIEEYKEADFPEFADKRCREIGYVISKDLWGRGLMPEAVKAVIRWLFEEIDLDAIFCGHFVWNGQSARVQEKCGFKKYGMNKYPTDYGTVEEEEITVLTKEEWASVQKNIL
ncbi:MAG: GNAT family N-acetyltransferase [Clostridia bacterium]|nr:GNAT family N-acetyltransferase [Clostridia bacterium]